MACPDHWTAMLGVVIVDVAHAHRRPGYRQSRTRGQQAAAADERRRTNTADSPERYSPLAAEAGR